jgi:peptidoglycan/LPS O-acetylase OafA/YrhL
VAWGACLAGFAVAGGTGSVAWSGFGGATVMTFFALGQLVQVLTAEAGTIAVLVASLGSYVVRAAGLATVLILADPLTEEPGRTALVVTIVVVVLAWLAAEIWTFTRLRIPAFDQP